MQHDYIRHVAVNSTVIKYSGIKSGWEQWVLLRSDVHHDNPKCDQALERKHLEEAKECDALVIDNGDLFCAMQGKWDKRSSKDALRPEHQSGDYFDRLVDTAIDFYRPYAKNFAVLGRGNHETSVRGRHETDLTDRLAAGLRRNGSDCIAGGYGGFVRFLFDSGKKESKVLHYYHGSGGGGPVTRGTIQTARLAVFCPDAHIVLTGHTHDSWTVPIARMRLSMQGVVYKDEQVHVRCAGYKDAWGDGSCGWEVERMLGPKPHDAAWLRFFYVNGEIDFEIVRAK
jgi:hypothetical protein